LWVSFTRRRDPRLAMARGRIVAAANPKGMSAHRELALTYLYLGHDEEVLPEASTIQTLRERDQAANLQGRGFADLAAESEILRATALGDFLKAARTDCPRCSPGGLALRQAEHFARAHDVAQSRYLIAQALALGPVREPLQNPTRSSLNKARYYLNL